MRQRHIPRLCRSCRAPMARPEDSCRRCGVQWASEAEPRNDRRMSSGGASGDEGTRNPLLRVRPLSNSPRRLAPSGASVPRPALIEEAA